MKIEKNVPIPKGTGKGAGKPTIYPFSEMEVGDSVFLDGQRTGGPAYLSAMQHGRMHGKKFSARSVDGGIRIWRIQ